MTSLDSPHEEGAALAPVINGAAVDAQVDVWAEARRMVEETKLPQGVIARELGLKATTLSARKLREGWAERSVGAPESFMPSGGRARWSGVEKPDKAAARRTRMIGRLYRAFGRQI